MYVTKQIQNKLYKRKVNVHQRSIFRQMMNTCDKLDNSFLSKNQSKRFDQKEKEQQMQTRQNSVIDKFDRQNYLERFSHDPFRGTKDSIFEDSVYVKESKQIKQIKILRQKMIPKVSKNNIEKKLKELTFIRNMGYKTKNKRLESFKTLSRQQDQQNTINKSWDGFYQDKLHFTPTQTPLLQERNPSRKTTKKPTYFLVSKINEQKLKEKEKEENALSTSLSPSLGLQTQPIYGQTFQSNALETSYDTFANLTALSFLNNQQILRKKNRNKTTFKEAMKSLSRNNSMKTTQNTKRYPLSSDRKKQITQKIGLNKEKLSKENAFKLYKLVKGGYELDRNDIEGEHISLKRFRQAKDNFTMLNTCFNKIREGRYMVQQPEKVFNDGSFKSLVYLTEIENKISPAAFRRIQQLNKVVN